MFDKSNIFDLTLSVLTSSSSLFNTQNPGSHCNKDPLKSIALLAFDKNLLYYNQRLLSTSHFLDHNRESQQITTPKTIVVLPGKDKKTVKRRRRFFAIFFNDKEIEHRILDDFNRIGLYLFSVKLELNSGIVGFLHLCVALNQGRFINTGESAAVFGFPVQFRFIVIMVPEATAVDSFFFLKVESIRNKSQQDSQITGYFNKRTAYPLGCINKNELNGPGSGISIRGGLYSQLLYVHTDGILYWTSSQRGWQPHPIHGQPDGVLYWASSQILFFFACFFIPSIKRIGSW